MSLLDHYLAVFYAPSFPDRIKLKTWFLYTEKSCRSFKGCFQVQGLLLKPNFEFRGQQQLVGICSCLNCKYSLERALVTIVIQNKSYLDHAVPDPLRDKLYLKEFIKIMKDVSHLEIFFPDKSKIKPIVLRSEKQLLHPYRLELTELDIDRQ